MSVSRPMPQSLVASLDGRRVGRRGLVLGAAGLVALRAAGGIRLAAAQDATPAAGAGAATAALPAHAAGWPKFNLNAATDEQLLGFPGSGDKMLDEFREYAPYTSIGQFRGEIGKYVSPEDVAAMEAYLFVPVDPNAADADTLQQLPGVTKDVADKIVAARPFADAAAFETALAGMVAPELAAVAAQFVGPDAPAVAMWPKYDLNTAGEDQLKVLPGSGEKMLDEFMEYRPYTTVAQFRGEIGKYISPEDVAKLEAYLYVPVAPNDADADTLQQLPGVTKDVADQLVAARPYADDAAFLAELGKLVSPDLAAAAKGFLGSGS